MTTIHLEQIYIPSKKIVTRIIEDDFIIVPIESDTIDFDHSLYSLTRTGREIWQSLNRHTTIEKICSDLVEKYDAPFETISKDVLELLKELLDKRLITLVE